MKSIFTTYGILLTLIIGLFIWIDSQKQVPVDWGYHYRTEQKEPFDLFILKQEIQSLFSNQHISYSKQTPYEVLNDENTNFQQYIFINNSVDLDKQSINYLLDFVNKGNLAFISTYNFPKYLLDTLKVKTSMSFSASLTTSNTDYQNTIKASFSNTKLDENIYTFDKGIKAVFFSKLDSLSTKVLGTQAYDNKRKVNFVKINYGNGYFLLHTLPVAFTNYNLLIPRHRPYAAHILSYLSNTNINIDSQNDFNMSKIGSPLRYILSQPALKWAWFLTLITLFTYIVVNGKRRQRIIPIIEAPSNTSIDFAKTIGDLYYNNKDASSISTKKVNIFLNNIRNEHMINTNVLDEKFKHKLHAKSGVPMKYISPLINHILLIKDLKNINDSHLVSLQKYIDNFQQNTQ